MELKKVKIIMTAVCIALILCCAAALIFRTPLTSYIALGVIAVFFVGRIVLWRCPHCKTHLGTNSVHFCPGCGRELHWK